ncbi:MAG: hypothetical protein KC643_11290 [Nitrospira sp.]|nr:hypothetical protein [Nitrospira sp.]
MKTTRLVPVVLVVASTLMSLLTNPSGAIGQSACGCTQQDKLDVESRIKQVKGAIQELDALVKEWEAREKAAGEPFDLDPDSKNVVADTLTFKMAGVADPNARRFGADTDRKCQVHISPGATPCLRGALEDHEAVHRAACEAARDQRPIYDIVGAINWRLKQRVVDYMKEEKAGYQKELERLTKELDQQKKNCKTVTKLDPSMQRQMKGAMAQQERLQSASNRLTKYGQSLN